MDFLEKIANDVLSQYGNDMARLCLVFPNRRAGLFFKKYLSQKIQGPVWSPKIMGISDFTAQFAPYEPGDRLQLVFELFQTFKQELATTENPERFFFWGETLLADFDEIDKYLIDAKSLFSNLALHKELDRPADYLSEAQKEHILQFWR
ncbi:MAG: PD-(D/E)XK nuclease family protein, partial [Cyclobacteriaceae bacterium]